jgi:hypothetical protein
MWAPKGGSKNAKGSSWGKTVPDEIITKVARFIGTDPTTIRKKSYH